MESGNFSIIFEKQKVFQQIIEKQFPSDHPDKFVDHIANMVEELGELLKADKRHKAYRNNYYNREEKLKELADVFIENMNLAIWSGFTAEDVLDAVESKIDENYKRAKAENIDQKK
jgi:NTP pyrophosphatase (non-canonical NTP hydrolase)